VTGQTPKGTSLAEVLCRTPVRAPHCEQLRLYRTFWEQPSSFSTQVPLNYSDPDGQDAVIAVIRKPAIIPPNSWLYRGPVIFNPGGPGGSGVDFLRGPNADLFSLILGPQFDILSFDPRGMCSTLFISLMVLRVKRNCTIYTTCIILQDRR